MRLAIEGHLGGHLKTLVFDEWGVDRFYNYLLNCRFLFVDLIDSVYDESAPAREIVK